MVFLDSLLVAIKGGRGETYSYLNKNKFNGMLVNWSPVATLKEYFRHLKVLINALNCPLGGFLAA